MLRNKILVFLLLAFVQRTHLPAQTGTQGGQFSHWPEIQLNVLVLDKTGQPLGALDRSSFHLFEDASERSITSITGRDAPVSLALLIDTSRSMLDAHPNLTGVATAVTRAMPPGSEVMAVLFSEHTSVVLPFTPTDPFPFSLLNYQDKHRGTALYDAVMVTEAYIAKNARNAKRALVVLSDGSDNSSHFPFVDALHSVQWPGAPTVYFALLPDPSAGMNEKRHSKLAAELLSSAGGGLALVSKKDQDFSALGANIGALISSQYVLTFTAAPATKGKNQKLEVRMDGQPANVMIHVLPSYFPPEQ